MSSLEPLKQLRDLKTSSSQFPALISNILDGTNYKVMVKTLSKLDVRWLVEYLDRVLGELNAANPAFRTCLRELGRICGAYQILPKSHTLSVPALGAESQPIARGYFGDVYVCSLNGAEVRVKRLLVPSGGSGQNSTRNFYEEAVTWKRLKHPNILPVLGISVTPSPQLISDWAEGGNLTEYVKNNPTADQLSLLSGIANGLEYLHSNEVIHGNLKGPNILVDGSGQARITDFGLAMIPQDQAAKRAFLDDQTARWLAPEILHDSGTYSKWSDIFAFAMVMIEVFTGSVPFDTSLPGVAAIAIMQGTRPPRPTDPTCSDDLWAMIQRCWDQKPHMRPGVSDVFQVLPGSAVSKLRHLFKPGTISHEFQLALGRFYGSPGYQGLINGLSGVDLKEFVDFLNSVLRAKGLNGTLLRQTLHSLRKVCSHHAVIPGSNIVSNDLLESSDDLSEGTKERDVWMGKLNRPHGEHRNNVQVKVINFERAQKERYGDVVTWTWLDHPNILQCFGMTLDPLQVVIERVSNGNMIEYVQTHLDADRICLLIDVAQGLDYLHSYGVIHGGLTSQCVLVNAAGRACLSDIGVATIQTKKLEADGTEGGASDLPRWTAPEVFKSGTFSKQSDVFSFGFVAAEMLTGQYIWESVTPTEIGPKIVNRERPRMPKGKENLGLTAEVWGMLTKCWETEEEERMKAPVILNFLQYTPQPNSGTSYNYERALVRSRCQPTQEFIDELDKVLDGNEVSDKERARFLNILCKTCNRQQTVPKSMHIACSFNEQAPVFRGGHANVFRGEERGRLVAVKVVRVYLKARELHLSRFCQEAVVWKHLQHPNILPILGVNLEDHTWAMVSEWMEHGDINKYIQNHKEVNRVQLLLDVAFGLEYMHNLQFAHGDLKGPNILISKDGRACLSDFGLSTIIRSTHQAATNAPAAETISLMSYAGGGTLRWMSPELLHPDGFEAEDARPTTQSDCYALGMVVYEVLVGKAPYWEINMESKAVQAIFGGVRPKKPYAAKNLGFTDGLWDIIERSWVADVDARPDVKTILCHLAHASAVWNRRQFA